MSKMSFLGGFSATDYYQGTNTGINDSVYTIGAIVAIGVGTSDQAFFSSLGTNVGFELRTADNWSYSSGQAFQAQAGVTTLTQPNAPVTPLAANRRVLFVCLSASATDNEQNLYINGALVATATNTAVAISDTNVRIGCRPDGDAPADETLVNSVFYTNDLLTISEIQAIYTWLGAYGRLPVNGVLGVGWQIDHFWDVIDNRTAIGATWTSRGAVGGKALTRAGTLFVASTGTAAWGW